MLVALGSTNPGKIKAVQHALVTMNLQARVQSLAVPSSVPAMPLTIEELKHGAITRAQNAYNQVIQENPQDSQHVLLSLGLEGGIFPRKGQWYLGGVTAGYNGQQTRWVQGFEIPIPSFLVTQVIDQGQELGDVIDAYVQKQNTKHEEGAIYYLTKNTIKRHEVFTMEVIMILSSFLVNDSKAFHEA